MFLTKLVNTLLTLLLTTSAQPAQQVPPDVLEAFPATKAETDKDGEEGDHYGRDILVIANRFPKELNFFCNPRNELMRDRLCYGQLDAHALACADDTPPLHLVPFCLAFKHHCHLVNYPTEDWCSREFDRYDVYCTQVEKSECKSCTHDISCYCEPYDCLWTRFGYKTAVWCQRYELFCNEKQRREKATELITLMENAIRIHYRCMHLFNLPNVICDPFRRQFDYSRCTKFLFDCELISEWNVEQETNVKEKEEEETENGAPEAPKKVLTPTPEDQKLAATIAEEEEELQRLLKEKEKESKEIAQSASDATTTAAITSSIASAATTEPKLGVQPVRSSLNSILAMGLKLANASAATASTTSSSPSMMAMALRRSGTNSNAIKSPFSTVRLSSRRLS